jgi:hypothetical protein
MSPAGVPDHVATERSPTMAVSGIRSVYVETHDWREALAFWRALGFKLEEDLGRSGTLRAPDGGPYLFIEEVPADQPLQVAPWSI